MTLGRGEFDIESRVGSDQIGKSGAHPKVREIYEYCFRDREGVLASRATLTG